MDEIISKIPINLFLITIGGIFLVFIGLILFAFYKGRSLKLWGIEIGNENNTKRKEELYLRNNTNNKIVRYEGIYEVYHYTPYNNKRIARSYLEISRNLKNGGVNIYYDHSLVKYPSGTSQVRAGHIFLTMNGKNDGVDLFLIIKEPTGDQNIINGICSGLTERNDFGSVEVVLKKVNIFTRNHEFVKIVDKKEVPNDVLEGFVNDTPDIMLYSKPNKK